MPPRLLRLAEESAREAFVATVSAGGLVIFPTDTVYGLGVRADRDEPVRRVYEAKGRPAHLALPVLVASAEGARKVSTGWTPEAEALAAAFWPGPLTLVLPAREGLSPLVLAGGRTVGVRMPNQPALLSWLAACDFPLAATSANRSGEAPAVRVEELAEELRAAVDLIVDGGPCPGAVPSTVVDVTSSPPRLLRAGPLAEQDILRLTAKLSDGASL